MSWRAGSRGDLSGRFAALRVRPSHRDYWRAEPHPEEWLLIEWPEGEEAPTKYWLSTLPANIGFRQFVDIVKLRWRIERDYHELKQEVGLGHFEGRSWRGFHHHATLCIAAYGFLVAERAAIPPSAGGTGRLVQAPCVPDCYRPRGAAAADRTSRPHFDRYTQTPHRSRPRANRAPMSLLRPDDHAAPCSSTMFVTQ